MRRTLFSLALSIWASAAFPALAEADNQPPMNRAQSVINAFQVMCTLELPNFDHLDARAAAMKMTLQANKSGPSANDTITRSKIWAGGLKDGPFLLVVDEMTGAKGRSTACAVVGEVPDVEAFRSEAIDTIKLQGDPVPEMGNDGSRSFVWNGHFGPGTIVIMRDFAPTGKRGVMMKLLSKVDPPK
jgi:hypothetical protein